MLLLYFRYVNKFFDVNISILKALALLQCTTFNKLKWVDVFTSSRSESTCLKFSDFVCKLSKISFNQALSLNNNLTFPCWNMPTWRIPDANTCDNEKLFLSENNLSQMLEFGILTKILLKTVLEKQKSIKFAVTKSFFVCFRKSYIYIYIYIYIYLYICILFY